MALVAQQNLEHLFTKGVPKEVLDRLGGYLLGRQDVQELIRQIRAMGEASPPEKEKAEENDALRAS